MGSFPVALPKRAKKKNEKKLLPPPPPSTRPAAPGEARSSPGQKPVPWLYVMLFTLWYFNIAIENGQL